MHSCKFCSKRLEPPDIAAYYLACSTCHSCYNARRRLRISELGRRSMDETTARHCNRCSAPLTPDNYYGSHKTRCKDCFKKDITDRKRKRGEDADSVDSEEPFVITETLLPLGVTQKTSDQTPERTQLEAETPLPPKQDDLYVMQNSRIPDEKKVGRSQDVSIRAKQLGQSQNFRMQILKVYSGQGYLESTIHKRLKARKVTEGDGQEWFQVDLQTLDMIIGGAIAESQL